jgi:hypothetical protein
VRSLFESPSLTSSNTRSKGCSGGGGDNRGDGRSEISTSDGGQIQSIEMSIPGADRVRVRVGSDYCLL